MNIALHLLYAFITVLLWHKKRGQARMLVPWDPQYASEAVAGLWRFTPSLLLLVPRPLRALHA
jgi:hypothetical protein